MQARGPRELKQVGWTGRSHRHQLGMVCQSAKAYHRVRKPSQYTVKQQNAHTHTHTHTHTHLIQVLCHMSGDRWKIKKNQTQRGGAEKYTFVHWTRGRCERSGVAITFPHAGSEH